MKEGLGVKQLSTHIPNAFFFLLHKSLFLFIIILYHHCLSFRCDQHCIIKNIYK